MTKFDRFIKKKYKYANGLAKDLGVCAASITNWMNGSSFPSPINIQKMNELSEGYISPNYWHLEFHKELEEIKKALL